MSRLRAARAALGGEAREKSLLAPDAAAAPPLPALEACPARTEADTALETSQLEVASLNAGVAELRRRLSDAERRCAVVAIGGLAGLGPVGA